MLYKRSLNKNFQLLRRKASSDQRKENRIIVKRLSHDIFLHQSCFLDPLLPPLAPFPFFRKFAKTFATQGAPPAALIPVANLPQATLSPVWTLSCEYPSEFILKNQKGTTTLQIQNGENLKQIFPEKEYWGLSPNFRIHVSVSELYILTMGLPFLLEEICGPILGIYKSPTDTWMWKLGLRPRNSQERNI